MNDARSTMEGVTKWERRGERKQLTGMLPCSGRDQRSNADKRPGLSFLRSTRY